MSMSKNRVSWLKLAIVMLTIAIIGLVTIGDYGISWDEPAGVWLPKWDIDEVTKGIKVTGLFQYDGNAFNFASEAIYQVQEAIYRIFSHQSSAYDSFKLNYEGAFLKRFQTKHLLTFLLSLVAYISAAKMVGIFCGLQYAWFGAMILAFFPGFWGHSFFNFKDIPFAAVFSLSTLVGSYLVNSYLSVDGKVSLRINRLTIISTIYGVIVGLLAGIRLGGIVAILFPFIAYTIIKVTTSPKTLFKDILDIIVCPILTFTTCFLTATICYPLSWSNPFIWFLHTLSTFSNYDWVGQMLFDGKVISSHSLPWNYIPVWFFITVPLIIQISFAVGLIFAFAKYKGFSYLQQACLILLVLQVFFIPVNVIIKKAVVYDAIRHFLFIMPAIAVLSASAMIWIYELLPSKYIKISGITLLIIALVQIRVDMGALHPYEYIYFNRVSGGLTKAYKRFETDYWGLSIREAMEWINQDDGRKLPVLVGGPREIASFFAKHDIKLLQYDEKTKPPNKPFYYLAVPKIVGKGNLQDNYLECKLVHQVVRQETPLTIVRLCE